MKTSSFFLEQLHQHGKLKMCSFSPTLCLLHMLVMPSKNKNSSGDETANVNFYAVRPDATRIRWTNAK